MSRITIKNIAQDMGLSRNTISMALKGDSKVAPETRRKIIAYAASKGYMKFPTENDLPYTMDSPIRISVIRRIDQTAYWDRVINGVSEESIKHNCIINISVVTQENIDNMQFPAGYSDNADACLFLHKFGLDYSRKLLGDNKIGIFLDNKDYIYQEPILGDVIKSEGRRSVMQLTQSLIQQGMKKIAYLCPYFISSETFRDRYEGYCDALRSAGMELDPDYIMTSSPHSDKTIAFQAAIDQLPDLPEAIVCSNDDSASKFATILMKKGIRIPEDVAITGYDNDEYDAFTPFFTTVDCNAYQLGKRMVQQLIWRINHPDSPFETITISSTPIYRKSSAKI